jgi:thiamine-phosphate pyrophosphorylase
VVERAAWWAEIFETPCAVYAPSLDTVETLAGTNAEFVALGDAVWSHPDGPAAGVKAAAAILERQEASR